MDRDRELVDLCGSVSDAVLAAAKNMTDVGFDVVQKGTAVNIVTSSDLAVEKSLRQSLKDIFPEAGFLTEETPRADDTEYRWVIDPIDGTANYARGMADCAVSVALVCGTDAVLAVVYAPRKAQLFTAVRGHGAFLNGKPIRVSDVPFEKAILCTAMSLYKKELTGVCNDIILEAYGQCNDFRRFGSCALELCYIAAGQCDLFFEARIFPWDYAAAHLVLTEAGGIIRGRKGAPLTFDRPTVIVAANTVDNYNRLAAIVDRHITSQLYPEALYD